MDTAISHAEREIKPFPWMELIGVVDRIGKESVTLKITYAVPMTSDLAGWADKLRVGSKIGVLFLDDDSVRVRILGVEEDGGGGRAGSS